MADDDSADDAQYEESAEELFELAPVGYLSFIEDGRIVRVNRTFLDWTGYERQALLSEHRFADLMSVPARLYYETTVAPTLHMQGSAREVALDLRCPERAPLPVLVNFAYVARGPTRPGLVRVAVFNASDRRRYENELLRARRRAEEATQAQQAARELAEHGSRLKDDFLAMISHELRTPLTAILGWTHLLSRTMPVDGKWKPGLDIIERNTRVQVQLVDDLLDLGRIMSGKMRLDVQRIELAGAVQAAVDTSRLAAEAKGIRLKVVLDPSVIVWGDPGRLQQVFWNLLSNAVKFTPKDGSIRVVMARNHSHVEVSVSDSGQGMSAEFLSQAFDRFKQADTIQTRTTTGLGLGLALVKQLVEMHGGSVEARSEGAGFGSTFLVQLPLAAALMDGQEEPVYPREALASAPSPVAPRVVGLHGISLVLVEDQEDSRELLRRVLTEAGAQVKAVATAGDAIQAVAEIHPGVLISDIGLPDMDGYELLRRVRMLGDSTGPVAAIALTAFARLDDRTRAMLAGFQVHLAKPVDARELILAVASLAGRLTT